MQRLCLIVTVDIYTELDFFGVKRNNNETFLFSKERAMSSLEILETFTIDNLPNLDTVVVGALELFTKVDVPVLNVHQYSRPLVVGSGNAEATGRIIFALSDAVFASESTYEEKLKNVPEIDGVIVISASGGKHAPGIVQTARSYNKDVMLITNTPGSDASRMLSPEKVHVFPKNREPYTYNTSTYLSMVFGHTQEDPAEITRFVKEFVDKLSFPDFAQYDKFYLIVPPEFTGVIRMLNVKFIELFGRKIARDIETSEYVAHATTVVPSDELFISFGKENVQWGNPKNRFNVPLPDDAGYAAMIAISYYVIGQIQKAHPPYFKDNIVKYTSEISEYFGSEISPIVE